MTAEVVDLSFVLRGRAVAEDYTELLWQQLRVRLPWLEDDAEAGVHPLAGISPGQGERYLSRHSRLLLRLAVDRVEDARRLSGTRLDLAGEVEVGAATVRALGPAAVLYSHFVHVGTADEGEFIAECRRLLDLAGVAPRLLAGKARSLRAGERQLHGFSLMLHGLEAEDSLRLQRSGLGGERKRGCGLLVPHKSVVAVGA